MNLKINDSVYQMIFGSFSGIMEHTITFIPRNILDFIQVYKDKNISSVLHKIYSKNNYYRITNGYFPMISCVGLSHINLFYFYEKSKLEKEQYMIFLYGSLGKLGHDIIACPGDTIRCHCNLMNINSCQATRNILKNGKHNLFNGLPSLLFMSIVGGSLEFSIINKLEKKYNNSKISIYNYLPGFVAGFISSVVLSPIDMLKTQMQTKTLTLDNHLNRDNFRSHYNLLLKNYKTLGFAGLFRGSLLRGFQSSICFGTYETLNNFFIKIDKYN